MSISQWTIFTWDVIDNIKTCIFYHLTIKRWNSICPFKMFQSNTRSNKILKMCKLNESFQEKDTEDRRESGAKDGHGIEGPTKNPSNSL